MIAATRRWFRRNRTNLAIGAGIIGATYLAGQYVLNKIRETRQRMSEDRIAKENLRRRFQQNQEDCTYTVLALLPTIREEIIEALPVEQITDQLQQERQERLRRSNVSEAASTEYPSVPPSIADEDGKSLTSSGYVHASQIVAGAAIDDTGSGARSLKRTKAQLWQDMKINSIARALTMIYTLTLLTMLTRIQLNLLGRRTYLSSVVALASPPPIASSTISLENRDDDNYDNVYGNDFETNRKYLTFSWWLLHRGSRQIMSLVLDAVKEVFGAVNIREDVTLERLAGLILQVRRRIEGVNDRERAQKKWLPFLLPDNKEDEAAVIQQAGMSESEGPASPEEKEMGIMSPSPREAYNEEIPTGPLRRLLDETKDLIDSPTFSHIMTRLLDTSYSHLIDYRIGTEAFKVSFADETARERITEVIDHKCKLAHVLPIFCRQAHVIAAGNGELDILDGVAAQEGIGNEYLAAIDQVQDLEAFAAVIYSSNFDYELEQTTLPTSDVQSASSASARQTPLAEDYLNDLQEQVDEVQAEKTVLPSKNIEPELVTGTASAEEPAAVSVVETAPENTTVKDQSLEAAWKKAIAHEDGVQVEAPEHTE